MIKHLCGYSFGYLLFPHPFCIAIIKNGPVAAVVTEGHEVRRHKILSRK